MKYNETDFIKKLETSDPKVLNIILNLSSNKNLSKILNEQKLDENSVFEIEHHLTNYILGFIEKDNLVIYISEILRVDEDISLEIFNRINDLVFFEIQPLIEQNKTIQKENLVKDKEPTETKTRPSDNDSISHIDILSEIENPTPSLKTTNPSQTQQPAQNRTINTQTIPSNHPAEPHQTGLGGFNNTQTTNTNPAQNIASKLNQNLSTPTTSIPKEIYVSKKPDPYHEPVI